MLLPITRSDFIITGRSCSSDDLAKELARLLPAAAEDIAELATRGYTLRMLQELKELRARIQAEPDEQRRRRNQAKKPVLDDATLVRDTVHVLRAGSAMACCAIASRKGPEGESPEAAREVVRSLMEHVESLGTPCHDPARLRVRLATMRWLLTLPELSPSASEARTRAEFVERLDTIARKLPAVASVHARPAEPTPFDDMDEVDGRAWLSLKLLTRVGRSVFHELGRADRAALYQLHALHGC